MKKKIKVSFFQRKPRENFDYSIEMFYKELFIYNSNVEIIIKKLPFVSKGFFTRVCSTIWCFFNQNEINHVSGDINFVNFLLKKEKTILTILDLYSLNRLKGLKRRIYKLFWLDLPLKRCSKIITISQKIKREIISNFKVESKKIEVISCSISSTFKRKNKKLNFKELNILFIGTGENKNLERSIKALKKLKIKLIIIGEIKLKYLDLLKKNKINYLNYVNQTQKQIFRHYINSDILLFPSEYEGFGIPILEAQAVGRLVVTSNNLKDISGKGAIYINPLSITDIRRKIINIQKKRYKVKKIIKIGFKNLDRYKLKDIKKKYLKVYNSFYENIGSN
ncbi:glycosyltransferase [Candidatus Pelagibacter bacterium nBUS_44]|uniref:glycosyltransferase n=1 Tax=Candidatus Pelagibacter bacterium nBUS_44 TaxID=3374195 RepID=UPI003EBE6ACA